MGSRARKLDSTPLASLKVRRLAADGIVGVWFADKAVLQKVRSGARSVVHSVPFTQGLTKRLRNTICKRPSWAEVERALEDMSDAELAPAPAAVAVPQDESAIHSVPAAMRFLRASRHLRRLRGCKEASSDILEATLPDLHRELEAEKSPWPSASFLVRSRCLFDIATMLIMRTAMARRREEFLGGSPTNFYMMCDGSPSSGFEALPILETITVGSRELACTSTRKLPVTYLGFGHMALADKVFGILWAIFLESGPDATLIRFRLERVRGWCTDQGVERGVADVEDLLPEFFAAIGSPVQVEKKRFLFPRALWVPGWHHMFDGVCKAVLGGLSWWPEWLKSVRAIIKFFRIESYRSVIADRARTAGFDDRLVRLTPPNFAHWRRGTLQLVLNWIVPIMSCLREVWDVSIFSGAKFGAIVKVVAAAFADQNFWLHLRVVADVNSRLQACRTWAAGCPCHDEARRAGETVSCPMQGRRLTEAKKRLNDFCADCGRLAVTSAADDMCSVELLGESLERDRAWAFRYSAAMVTLWSTCRSPWPGLATGRS